MLIFEPSLEFYFKPLNSERSRSIRLKITYTGRVPIAWILRPTDSYWFTVSPMSVCTLKSQQSPMFYFVHRSCCAIIHRFMIYYKFRKNTILCSINGLFLQILVLLEDVKNNAPLDQPVFQLPGLVIEWLHVSVRDLARFQLGNMPVKQRILRIPSITSDKQTVASASTSL
ncbi:putative H(+)-transporting two-sector ATPase subunit F.a [Trichinella spiralis]|uniref:putative H(+)-transporting two-sector ATPase subunit F.a n=1 Tax=Trichinella spiralis TaxID=6334 RepID=UPI0001EFBB2F|nr:putative H(+)-transporting two-sector ATPase subunit F.a [Trichinella spiralis]